MLPTRLCRLFLALGLATGLLAPPFGAATVGATGSTWEIYDLGISSGGQTISAHGINDQGIVVGSVVNTAGAGRPISWTYGALTDLTSAALTTVNGTQLLPSSAVGINSQGVILGNYLSACSTTCFGGSFLLDPSGTPTVINGQDLSYPVGVNNTRQVAGEASGTHAALWQNGTVLVEDPNDNSWAYGLNDNGVVVGQGAHGDAYMWLNGVGTDLGNLPGGCGGSAYGVNNAEQVFGVANVPDSWGKCSGAAEGFVWQNGVMTGLGSFFPQAINDAGQIAGSDSGGIGIWQNGQVTSLTPLLPSNSGWSLLSVQAMNNQGQIVGTGSYQGANHAYLLNPPSLPLHPYLQLAPTTSPHGASLVISAGGFAPGETVNLLWNCPSLGCAGATNLGTVLASPFGSLNRAPITIPPTALPGTYQLAGQGSSGTFQRIPFTVVAYVGANPNAGLVGSTIQLTGSGFGANETVTARWNCAAPGCTSATVLGTTTSDANGNLSLSATAPNAANNIYPIGLLGSTSGGFAVADFSIGTTAAGPATSSVARFTSPRHDGFVNDPTLTTPLSLLWERDLGGNVSYPVIGGGKIFVMIPSSSPWGVTLFALSAKNGVTLWSKLIAETYPMGDIAYDGNKVFLLTGDGVLFAFDANTGNQLWQYTLPSAGINVSGSPPIAVGGVLYTTGPANHGTLYALNDSTGTVNWSAQIQGGANPALSGATLYLASACGASAVSARDGHTIWSEAFSCLSTFASATIVHDQKVYTSLPPIQILNASTGAALGAFTSSWPPTFGGKQGAVLTSNWYSLGVLQGITETGRVTWTFTGDNSLGGPPQPTTTPTLPLIVGNIAFTESVDGNVFAVSLANGRLLSETSQRPFTQNTSGALNPNLGAGGGILVVPSGSLLTAYR